MRRRRRGILLSLGRVLGLAAASAVLACGGGEGGPYADRISIVPETDGQTAPADGRLSVPLAVMVRSNEGQVMPRVRVRWKAATGAGTLSDSISVSDADGRAQMDLVVGRVIGAGSVHAELAVNFIRYVTFATTTSTPPTLTTVSPSQFTGGDLVTVEGTGLTASAQFEVNGASARVTSGTGTSVSVIIPVCLAPGPATLRARVNGGASNSINGTYVAPGGLMLGPGEYASIDPSQLASCASFPPAGPGGAEYLIAPQGVSGSPGASASYRLVGDSVVQVMAVVPAAREPETAASAFHGSLRRREQESSQRAGEPRAGPIPAPAAAVPYRLGDQRGFRVCSKLDCNTLNDFPRVESRARFVGQHVVIFEDLAAPANGFSDADLANMGQSFDAVLYDVATRAFGTESDIDANGVVLVLLTPVVNQLTPRDQCSTGFVTGYFFPIDLDPSFTADPRANPGEVFYSLVPDPDGSVSCVQAKDRLMRIVPSVFIHEFQHMINYNQHVLVRRKPPEQIWLNEALSHLAEELGGLKFREMGQQQVFSDFVIGDLYNAFAFLKSPGSHAVAFPGVGTLPERGAAWLFTRWLVDRFGSDLTRRLSETALVGQENIASATGEPLSRLLSQWFLANYVTDLPGFTPPAALRYDSWSFRTTFASLHQQVPDRFDRPFPLEPLQVSGGSVSATGSLRAGSGDYFRFTQSGGQRGFTLRLTDPAGAAVSGTVAPRLNVIRIR